VTEIGADAEALEALGRQFGRASEELDRVRSRLAGGLGQARWQGRDAETFRQSWERELVPALARAGEFLREGGRALAVNAGEQRQASSATGAGLVGAAGGFAGVTVSASVMAALSPMEVARVLRDGVNVGGEKSWDANHRWWEGSSSGALGGLPWQASSSVSSGLSAQAGATGHLGLDGAALGVSAGARAALIEATSAASMTLGLATLKGAVSGFVGGRVEGNAGIGIDRHGGHVSAGGSAFVGGEVSASGAVKVSGVNAGATVTGQAGLGITFKPDFSFEDKKLHLRPEVGVAVGLGGKVRPDITIDAGQIAHDVQKALPKLDAPHMTLRLPH
jgi:hypothetical protein